MSAPTVHVDAVVLPKEVAFVCTHAQQSFGLVLPLCARQNSKPTRQLTNKLFQFVLVLDVVFDLRAQRTMHGVTMSPL